MTRRQVLLGCFAAGSAAHCLAATAVWRGWAHGTRGVWLVWMDFPLSLLWLSARGPALFAWTLLGGGLWWGLLTAGLAWLTGRLLSGRRG